MKKFLCLMMLLCATMCVSAQVYYQQIDKRVSIGVEKLNDVSKLVILTGNPEFELIVNDRFVKTECYRLDKHNYEHIVIIPNPVLETIKNNLRHGSVFVNGIEYSALDFGAGIAAAEWYSDYYRDRNMHSTHIPKHKPFSQNFRKHHGEIRNNPQQQ